VRPWPACSSPAYAGLAMPVVGLGLATQLLSPRDAVLGFAAVLVAVVAVVGRRLLGTHRVKNTDDR
jgi:hypothetical protein